MKENLENNEPDITEKDVISNIQQFHYPAIQDIIKELESITVVVQNPVYQQPVKHLEKSIYLIQIIQNLIQNRHCQPLIVPRLIDIIKHFLEELQKICQNNQSLIEGMLRAIDNKLNNIGEYFITALTLLADNKYPEAISSNTWRQSDRDIRTWCITTILSVNHILKFKISKALYSHGKEMLHSIQYFSELSKELFINYNSTSDYDDVTFNIYFNQAVLWTAVLNIYQISIDNEVLDDNIDFTISLLKNETRQFHIWLNMFNNNATSSITIKYIKHLLKNLTHKSNEIEFTEVNTYIEHYKTNLMCLS